MNLLRRATNLGPRWNLHTTAVTLARLPDADPRQGAAGRADRLGARISPWGQYRDGLWARRAGLAAWLAGSLAVALIRGAAAQPLASRLPMHIMEGYLPPLWAALWFAVAVPFWILGFFQIRRLVAERRETRLLLGLCGAYVFVLSALRLPSVTGSSSHPTGTGFGSMLFGAPVMSILSSIVLLFQALLLAEGGLTTLGANAVSMAIAGPLVAVLLWRTLRGRLPLHFTVFVVAACADLMTYVMTSTQLALAYPDAMGGFLAAFLKFAGIFAVTQVPLAVVEGILTVVLFDALRSTAPGDLQALGMELHR